MAKDHSPAAQIHVALELLMIPDCSSSLRRIPGWEPRDKTQVPLMLSGTAMATPGKEHHAHKYTLHGFHVSNFTLRTRPSISSCCPATSLPSTKPAFDGNNRNK